MNREQKDSLQEFIKQLPDSHTKNAAQLWVENIESNVTESELDALQGLFKGHEHEDEVRRFVELVKEGGVRPGHPH